MPPNTAKAIELFYLYAHEDELLQNELEKHLGLLQRQGYITSWSDRDLSAGTDWEQEATQFLSTSQIILLLVSPDFINSDYCYSVGMKCAIARHNAKEALVYPIILRSVDLQDAPFSELPVLPTDGKPVTSWPNRDDAFKDIAREIRSAIEKMRAKQFLDEGDDHLTHKRFEEALVAYSQAIILSPTNVHAYNGKGDVLLGLGRHEEALVIYEKAIALDPTDVRAYLYKYAVLFALGRREEALTFLVQSEEVHKAMGQAIGPFLINLLNSGLLTVTDVQRLANSPFVKNLGFSIIKNIGLPGLKKLSGFVKTTLSDRAPISPLPDTIPKTMLSANASTSATPDTTSTDMPLADSSLSPGTEPTTDSQAEASL